MHVLKTGLVGYPDGCPKNIFCSTGAEVDQYRCGLVIFIDAARKPRRFVSRSIFNFGGKTMEAMLKDPRITLRRDRFRRGKDRRILSEDVTDELRVRKNRRDNDRRESTDRRI